MNKTFGNEKRPQEEKSTSVVPLVSFVDPHFFGFDPHFSDLSSPMSTDNETIRNDDDDNDGDDDTEKDGSAFFIPGATGFVDTSLSKKADVAQKDEEELQQKDPAQECFFWFASLFRYLFLQSLTTFCPYDDDDHEPPLKKTLEKKNIGDKPKDEKNVQNVEKEALKNRKVKKKETGEKEKKDEKDEKEEEKKEKKEKEEKEKKRLMYNEFFESMVQVGLRPWRDPVLRSILFDKKIFSLGQLFIASKLVDLGPESSKILFQKDPTVRLEPKVIALYKSWDNDPSSSFLKETEPEDSETPKTDPIIIKDDIKNFCGNEKHKDPNDHDAEQKKSVIAQIEVVSMYTTSYLCC